MHLMLLVLFFILVSFSTTTPSTFFTVAMASPSSSALLKGCKLTYFPIPGRGEATRLALAIGGISFDDHRVTFPEWKDFKPTTPWGSMPILTLSDGRAVAQQRAILRLVGKETGLYPLDDTVAAAKIDEVMDVCEDVGSKVMAAGQGLPQAEKEAKRAESCSPGGTTHALLSALDAYISANGKNGHVVGDTLSIADLLVYTASCNLVSGLYDGVPTTAVDALSNIQATRKMVRSLPAVDKWFQDHPAAWPSYGAL